MRTFGYNMGGDWHPADVLAALKKRGHMLSALSIDNGYHPTAAGKALRQPWPALKAIVAAAIGLPVSSIWPSRYGLSAPASKAPTPGFGESAPMLMPD